MSRANDVEQRDAVVHIVIVRVVEQFEPSHRSRAFLTPGGRYAIVELGSDPTVHLVEVDHIQSVPELVGFRAQASLCCIPFLALIDVPFAQGALHKPENLVIEPQA